MYPIISVTSEYTRHKLNLLTNAARLLFLETMHAKLSVNAVEHPHRVLLLDVIDRKASALTPNEAFDRRVISAQIKDALNKDGGIITGVWDGHTLSMFKYDLDSIRPSATEVLNIEKYVRKPRPIEYDWGILHALSIFPNERVDVTVPLLWSAPYAIVVDPDHVIDGLPTVTSVTALFPNTKEFVRINWGKGS